MSNKVINIGLVGLGRAGWGMHLDELKGRERKFKVVAACDPIKARREKVAERCGCETYADIKAMLKDPNVELVDIASRSPEHVEHAILALRAGKCVFLEKPISISYQEALKLKRAIRTRPNKLFIRHNRRFEAGFQHIREIIDSGILGEVYEIKLRRHGYKRRDDWQTIKRCGGGQLLNWGPHVIDHALRFLNGKVDSVWSDLRKVAAVGDAEDHVHIIMKGGKKGCVVDLEISGGVAKGEPTYTVFGTKGALKSSGNNIELKYLNPKKKLAPRRAKTASPELGTGFGGADKLYWIEKEIKIAPKTKCNTSDIWDHLYNSIRNGKPFPIKLDEAIQVMKIVSQVKQGTPFA